MRRIRAPIPATRPNPARPAAETRESRCGRSLADLMRAKMALVAVCRHCKRQRLIYPANLVPRFGEDCPTLELRRRLRCKACKSAAASLHAVSR